jgi:hypothetical protein
VIVASFIAPCKGIFPMCIPKRKGVSNAVEITAPTVYDV